MYRTFFSLFECKNNRIHFFVPSGNRFAHKNVVKSYCHLLRSYSTNTTLTNHCVIKILHRIAFDCKMPAMIFQLSIFKTFQKIMDDPRAKTETTVKVWFIVILFRLVHFIFLAPNLSSCFFT
jgi:timeless